MKISVNENAYEATLKAGLSILREAKKNAAPGTIYAIQKGELIILVNDKSDGKVYRKNEYKVLRKRADFGSKHKKVIKGAL